MAAQDSLCLTLLKPQDRFSLNKAQSCRRTANNADTDQKTPYRLISGQTDLGLFAITCLLENL